MTARARCGKASPNWANRTMWTGDNLHVMRGMNSESVDLIYLDPPFNSNRNYSAPIGSEAAGAAFKDTWTLDDLDIAEHGYLADSEPKLHAIIDAARLVHGKSMMSYMVMMGTRLIEMRRLLKPTGSIYLHCDPTAGAYLRIAMDAVFGKANFQNEIVWKYGKVSNSNAAKFLREHDVILAYKKSRAATFNPLFDSKISDRKRQLIRQGYNTKNMGGKRYLYVYDEETLRGKERLGKVDRSDFDVVRTVDAKRGNRLTDVFEIGFLNSQSKEKVGYPTQKPRSLLERIIKASSNKGDMVLDPFCGCATACVAAERLGRRWVGIDLSSMAIKLVKNRIKAEIGLFAYKITERGDIPARTDVGKLPNYRTHKHTLFGRQEGRCLCGERFPFRNFTMDHVIPQSRGGTDHVSNLMLLCGACNSLKGDRDMKYLMAKLKERKIKLDVSVIPSRPR